MIASPHISFLKDFLKSSIDKKTAILVIKELLQYIDNAQIIHPDFFPLNYITHILKENCISASVIKSIQDKMSLHGNFILKHHQLNKILNKLFPDAKIIPVAHHLAHAASAFYGSSFKTSAILTLDGQGEISTASLGHASNNKIELIRQTDWPNSLDILYATLAFGFAGDDPRYLGYGDEFKVMGISAYGKPKYLDLFQELGYVNSKGDFKFNFNIEHVNLIPVEGCEGHFQPDISRWLEEKIYSKRIEGEPFSKYIMIWHCSGQRFLEKVAVKMAKNLKNISQKRKIFALQVELLLMG